MCNESQSICVKKKTKILGHTNYFNNLNMCHVLELTVSMMHNERGRTPVMRIVETNFTVLCCS